MAGCGGGGRDGRHGYGRGNREPDAGKVTCYPAAMQCLANITQSLQDLVSPHMDCILGPLFSNGLSDQVGMERRHWCAQRELSFLLLCCCYCRWWW